MCERNWPGIWMEQCAAAETIKLRYGIKVAFYYVVLEKLLRFAETTARHPEFARELPRFVSRVRRFAVIKEIFIVTTLGMS